MVRKLIDLLALLLLAIVAAASVQADGPFEGVGE